MRLQSILCTAAILCGLLGCIHADNPSNLSDWMSPQEQEALLKADVIFLGEQHDNPHHHRLQAEIIEMLAGAKLVGDIVFEQLTWEQQPLVSNLSNRGLWQLPETLKWDSSGWPSYSFYAPLFAAATRYRIPIIAGNISNETSKAIYKDGYSIAFTADEQKLLGLTTELDEAAMEAIKQEIFDGHCQMIPKQHVLAMVPIQRARDAAMALAWLRLHKSGKSLFIVGSGHARKDFGIPWYLRQAQPELKIWSIGMNEQGAEADAKVYDQIITTAAIQREDPCLELQKKWNKDKVETK